LALTATLCFVTKRVHAALGAQMRVGAGLELVVIAAGCAGGVEVTGRARCVAAWTAVVKLTGWASTLTISRLSIAITRGTLFATACGTVTELSTFAIACRAIAHAVTAHMAAGARGAAFRGTALATTTATTRIATAACGFGVANALHHFAACCFGGSCHHVAAWGLA
jgi:hypothetical protein